MISFNNCIYTFEELVVFIKEIETVGYFNISMMNPFKAKSRKNSEYVKQNMNQCLLKT